MPESLPRGRTHSGRREKACSFGLAAFKAADHIAVREVFAISHCSFQEGKLLGLKAAFLLLAAPRALDNGFLNWSCFLLLLILAYSVINLTCSLSYHLTSNCSSFRIQLRRHIFFKTFLDFPQPGLSGLLLCSPVALGSFSYLSVF